MLELLLAIALQVGTANPVAPPANPTGTAAAAAAAAAAVVVRVQAYYQKIDKLQANFRQSYTNVIVGRTSTSEGRIYIQKPGKMRWWYRTPEVKHFFSDGETLWVYDVPNQQVFKQVLRDQLLPVAVTFLYGQGDLAKDFVPALDPGRYGVQGDVVLALTPKQPSAQYKRLWLVVDPTDYHVKESIILDGSDNVNHFKFTRLKINADAKDVVAKTFRFKPPKGVKIVEPGAPGTRGTRGANE